MWVARCCLASRHDTRTRSESTRRLQRQCVEQSRFLLTADSRRLPGMVAVQSVSESVWGICRCRRSHRLLVERCHYLSADFIARIMSEGVMLLGPALALWTMHEGFPGILCICYMKMSFKTWSICGWETLDDESPGNYVIKNIYGKRSEKRLPGPPRRLHLHSFGHWVTL